MQIHCADVGTAVHPYLDGEFADSERAELERHLAECAPCRELVQHQAAFKRRLQQRLAAPAAPSDLKLRLAAAMDDVDQASGRGAGRSRARIGVLGWILPSSAVVAAAAAITLFFTVQANRGRAAGIASEAVATHRRNLPVEVRGDVDRVSSYLASYMPIAVRPPPLSRGVELRGARLSRIVDRDAAQLVYDVVPSLPRGRRHTLTVLMFDPSGLSFEGAPVRQAGTRRVFVSTARGYNVVYFVENGVGYAFASDLDEADMLRLLADHLPGQ